MPTRDNRDVEEKPDIISQQELADEENRIFAEYHERFHPHAYRQVFYPPEAETWRVDALYVEGFFEAARLLLKGIANRSLNQCIDGFPAVFLCRHYLELALKYALFHSGWLKDSNHNADDNGIKPVGKNFGHNLQKLWDTVIAELKSRGIATGLDLDFVAQFVKEFDAIDKHNVRFRYAGEELPASATHETLNIDFDSLLFNLQRTYDVLSSLDSYLVETHGENEEWEEIQNSW